MTQLYFQPRTTVEQVEESTDLAPKFGEDGLMPCITTDATTGEVLMLGWMNAEAFRLTIQTGEAHYFSRARQVLWHKGATSGLIQTVVEARIDDDQDALLLIVTEN
ncbi:phosphoribosyl-AMP cyclohydrolase [Pseudophaeobacter profundi]|uniref:phosphoribosyl-AMP cyclohydrolase n=1 Tax=Pseudophaeobacter profundi TaxID=3034152 RepID=UPI0024315540|nr:phosphoribosyl-AMP cyclohydrolase [Pseudophaeobacter profundi]